MNTKKQTAFTIIELLIVIVIIAILATITIIAYNGITAKANQASAQSAADQANKAVLAYMVQNADQVPATLAAANVTNSGNTTYQYSYNNSVTPNAFCLTATTANISYYIDNQNHNTPTAGACAGQAPNGGTVVENLSTNPSAESSITGFGGPNGSTVAQSTAEAESGHDSVLVTIPASTSGRVGVMVAAGTVGTDLQANTTYTVSNYVYLLSGTIGQNLSAQGAGIASRTCLSSTPSAITTTTGSWVRLSCQFTTAASGTFNIYDINNGTATAGMQFYVDAVMITQGATLYNYADGNTAGWAWTGATNSSSSTGPPSS